MNTAPTAIRSITTSSPSRRAGFAVTAFCTLFLLGLHSAAFADAPQCGQAGNWVPTGNPGELKASWSLTNCSVIPNGWGWTEVSFSPPSSTTQYFVRINLSGTSPRWRWNGNLFVRAVGTTKEIVSQAGGYVWLKPYPPTQGAIGAGSVVRLRHTNTGKCAYTTSSNLGYVYNWGCWDNSKMTFVVDSAGSGTYRLRNLSTGQCLYATGANGDPARTQSCSSSSSTLRFNLDKSGSIYRLRNSDTSDCLYGSSSDGGQVRSNTCTSSSGYSYNLDRLQ